MDLTLSDHFQNYQAYGLTFSSNLPFKPWLLTTNQSASFMVEGRYVTGDLYNPEVAPLFASPQRDHFGRPILHLYRLSETLYLRIPTAGGFFIESNKILVQIQPGIDLIVVCAAVLSHAFTLWLEQYKTRCLHASSLCFCGRAAAFMADSTTGKSTLAAALVQAGAKLLGDDIASLTETEGMFMINPSYPTMRLSKSQAKQFLGTQAELSYWFPALGKALVPVGEGGWGGYCNTSQQLRRLYILERNIDIRFEEIRFEPLSKADAVLTLIRFSFGRRSPLALGIAVERMAFFARLVEQVDVFRLTYPSGYEHLPEITRRIFQDIDKSECI